MTQSCRATRSKPKQSHEFETDQNRQYVALAFPHALGRFLWLCFFRASTEPVKFSVLKTSLGLYSDSRFNTLQHRTGRRAEAYT
jgi:hypothetical protein